MIKTSSIINGALRLPKVGMALSSLFISILMQMSAFGFKVEQTTLAEQVKRANLVCVVEITKETASYSGNILELLKSPAGYSQKSVMFDTVALRPEDIPRFKVGQKVVLLLRESSEGKWESAAYGTQAIWPKMETTWPYTEGHIASLKDTIDAVKLLSKLDEKPDEAVQSLIKSPVPLQRVVGLEILVRSDTLTKYPLAIAEAVTKTGDPQNEVARLAAMVTKKKEESKTSK